MFQTLPYLIIDNIVEQLLAHNRTNCMNRCYFQLEGLLHSCQSWRLAVIPHLCKNGIFPKSYDFKPFDQPVLHVPDWPYSSKNPPPNTKQFIKSLRLEIDFKAMVANEPLDYLKYDVDGNPFVLENARKLYCRLFFPFMKYLSKQSMDTAKTNLDELVRLLISLTPNIQEVYLISEYNELDEEGSKKLKFVSSFITQLSRIAKSKFSISARPPALKTSAIKGFCIPTSVTHLEFLDGGWCRFAPFLITSCSSKLQTLSIIIKHFDDYLGLLLDKTTGKSIVYPCMRSLYIKFSRYDIYNYKEYTHEDGAPFPILQSLIVKETDALIQGDELFRANNNTLQYLDIEVDSYWVKVLAVKCVFYPGSHKNLTTAKISISDGWGTRHSTQTEINVDEYVELCGNIASNVSVFECETILHNSTIKASQLAPQLYGFPLLRKLDISELELTFKEAFELVRTLPLLSHLRGYFKASFIKPRNKTRDKYLEYMVNKYFPLNSSLTHLNLSLYPRGVIINDVRYILMLVILCPNIYRLERIKHCDYYYSYYKNKIMEEKGYDKYQSRISNLQF